MTTPVPTTTSSGRLTRAAAGCVVLLGLTLGLSACGGSDTSATPTASASADARAGRGQGGERMQQIQACLKAAGISVPTPSGMPRGGPDGGTPPSGMPSGAPPSGAPSGGPGGGRGRGAGIDFKDKKVQAALKACGITVPTAAPSAAPSS